MKWTHSVIEPTSGRVVGRARNVKFFDDGRAFAFVELEGMTDYAEYGYVPAEELRAIEPDD